MIVAFIPVRGGSKSIPMKNIKEIAGKPLVYWAAKAAGDCPAIDKVYVATDSALIRNKVNEFEIHKLVVIDRSSETASDTASTESAMIEFAKEYEFDDIVLIQATSPLLTSDDLMNGIKIYQEADVDSVLSVVKQKRFHWKVDQDGFVQPVNYDYMNRPRRQEFSGCLVENGAFYITGRERLLKTGNRISGNIKACLMNENTYFEIDELADWIIVENLIKNCIDVKEKEFKDIKVFLTDCDGCLTDGGMYYSENGDELKRFNTKDGMGFKLLRERGIITGIITGENRKLNEKRADKLKVDELYQGVSDKLAVFEAICKKYNAKPSEIAYVGDDINDIECIKKAGFSACPADAMGEVKQYVDYVAERKGGDGAIREIIHKLLC